MQGFQEFTNLNSRQKEIEFKTTIQGKEVEGTFVVKFPSLRDRIAIEAKLSEILDGADLINIKTDAYMLAEGICYIERLIIKKPDWFNLEAIDDPNTIIDLYNEVLAFINSFRKEDESDESKGDSGQSMDKESMEG